MSRPGRLSDLRGGALGLLPIVWIGIGLSVLQQFVGINVIFYYSTTLWKAVGFQEKDSLTISVATAITNILVTLVAIALVDRIGRRPIMLAGSIGMAVSLGTMALAFGSATGTGDAISLPGAWGPVALVAANVFVISFGASWGPLVWVLLGEIFPSRIRARALGLAAAAQWIANFAITLSFPAMAAASLPLTYAMYAMFAAASFFLAPRMLRTNRPNCSAMSEYARSCQPQTAHSTLLRMNSQKPAPRRPFRCEATSQAATRVATMAGHCKKSRRSSASITALPQP